MSWVNGRWSVQALARTGQARYGAVAGDGRRSAAGPRVAVGSARLECGRASGHMTQARHEGGDRGPEAEKSVGRVTAPALARPGSVEGLQGCARARSGGERTLGASVAVGCSGDGKERGKRSRGRGLTTRCRGLAVGVEGDDGDDYPARR